MPRLVLVLTCLFAAGCSKPAEREVSLPPNVKAAMDDVAKRQSAGFRGGQCVIQTAYRYTGPAIPPERGCPAARRRDRDFRLRRGL